MSQSRQQKFETLAALHVKGDPIVLYNIWDAGSAAAVAECGAKAVATGSASVAGAQNYPDGEGLPMQLSIATAARIAQSVDLPLSLDFEGGYATDLREVAQNAVLVAKSGAVGINFEDQIVGGEGLHNISEQAARIKAIKDLTNSEGLPLFVNARTDLFLKQRDPAQQAGLLDQALARAEAYTAAGADSFFVPGLGDLNVLKKICEQVSLPVNALKMAPTPALAELAACGVARVSLGPWPYRQMIDQVKQHYGQVIAELST